jgi:AcrR family transcriptional regulator
MTKDEKIEAKQRIFNAALSLFACKGYAAVGIREIAKAAKVNISMINYYYEGKIGILKAIVNECYERYYEAVGAIYDENVSPEDGVRDVIRKVIDFHRKNWELIMVAMHATPVDIPEILDLKLKWVKTKRRGAEEFFARLGLDTSDKVTMGVIRGVITTIIGEHFQHRHVWEHIVKSQITKDPSLKETTCTYDDTYYEQFAEVLARLYFYGVCGLKNEKQKK